MRLRYHAIIVGIVLGAGDVHALGTALYSVDVDGDRLVRIDTGTGLVSVVGALGAQVEFVDLAFSGGTLYAVDSRVDAGVNLLSISIGSGAVGSSVPLLRNGTTTILAADGLAAAPDGQLWVSLSNVSPNTHSDALGPLSLDGSVVGAKTFSIVSSLADFDALAIDDSGAVVSADTRSDLGVVRIQDLDYTTRTMSTRRSLAFEPSLQQINDLVFADGWLFGIDAISGHLHRMDPVSAELLESIPLSPGYSLHGLAVPAPPVCAGPLVAGALLVSRRRRD